MSDKPTKGPWIADNNESYSPWVIWSCMTPTGHGQPGERIAEVFGDSAEADANARLIAEAGTVYHETGLTPRELVDLLRRVEPHLDAIVCYASTMNECDGNRLAADIRAALSAERKT